MKNNKRSERENFMPDGFKLPITNYTNAKYGMMSSLYIPVIHIDDTINGWLYDTIRLVFFKRSER